MKKVLFVTLIALLISGLNSCSTYGTASSNKWLDYELPPSKVVYNGNVIFGGKLSNGSTFYVFADEKIEDDAKYYYTILMQDFGWSFVGNGKMTAPYDARVKKNGHIYINPLKQVAVYFSPDGDYSAFKVNIN